MIDIRIHYDDFFYHNFNLYKEEISIKNTYKLQKITSPKNGAIRNVMYVSLKSYLMIFSVSQILLLPYSDTMKMLLELHHSCTV